MTRRLRTGVFLVGVAGFAALLGWGFAGLPDFGHYVGPYGNVIVEVVKPQRHIANAVTAVVFDYRGFDTMGEELILFAAFTGIAILLRETREHDVRDIVDAVHSDAVEAVGLVAVPVTFVLALYVIAHGYLSPGGGFQGGVVVSAAFLLVFLTGEYRGYLSVAPATAWEAAEGVGAGGFVFLGMFSLTFGLAFLQNFMDLGTFGSLTSSGSVALVNWSSALAVAAGFVLIYGEYLQEAMALRHGKVSR